MVYNQEVTQAVLFMRQTAQVEARLMEILSGQDL